MLSSILMLIAGFGVFLFGIQTFSNNVEKISGNKMRKKINQFSKNRFAGIGFGFAFTTITQSSKVSIMLIAGFTSAGIVSLFQAFSLTLGSSMATAIPNFLISISSFNIQEFFYALSGVGVLIYLFAKKPLLKNIATGLIGFSLIFIGMGMMGTGTAFFSSNPAFINFFQSLTNPILLMLIGIGFTMITQSSLATIAVLMTLVGTAGVAGVIPITSAAYIVYGANIGSAIMTQVMVSLSSNIDGKRIAFFHTIYIVISAIIFALLSILPWIETLFSWVSEPTIKIAFINLTFTFATGLLVIPLLNPAVHLMKKIMPGKKSKRKNALEIDEFSSESPAVALARANEKIIPFYDAMTSLYNKIADYITESDITKHKKLLNDLSEFNYLINKLNMYVIRITTSEASETVNKEIELLLKIIKQMERINRNSVKALSVLKKESKKITYSQKSQKYIKTIIQNTNEMFDIAKHFILNPNCKFLKDETSNLYEDILMLSQKNSETKLSAKTFIIEKGFNSKQSTEKNTSYIEFVSYFGLISNNVLDIVFNIVGQASNSINPKYEQLILDEFADNDQE